MVVLAGELAFGKLSLNSTLFTVLFVAGVGCSEFAGGF